MKSSWYVKGEGYRLIMYTCIVGLYLDVICRFVYITCTPHSSINEKRICTWYLRSLDKASNLAEWCKDKSLEMALAETVASLHHMQRTLWTGGCTPALPPGHRGCHVGRRVHTDVSKQYMNSMKLGSILLV